METQTKQRIQFTNVAGLSFYSTFQASSLFTLSAQFKDGNKTKCHSWRQEIRTKEFKVDQEHAYMRMIQLAENCTCRINPKNCFSCNHQSILIFCNLTDQLIYKLAHKKIKMMLSLSWGTSENGNVYLTNINGTPVTKLAVQHSKQNIQFNNNNK